MNHIDTMKLAQELALDVRANANVRLAAKAIALTGVIDSALAEQPAQQEQLADKHQAFIDSLPSDMEDKMFEQIHYWARQSYARHQRSTRGQTITAADSSDSHIIWAALRWAKENAATPQAQPAQQCKWPICQSEEYQQVLAEQIKRELVGEQPAQQEPYGWHTEDHLTDRSATTYSKDVADRWKSKGWPVTPLYTSPPAQPSKPWVGLTPEDHQAAWDAMSDYEDYDTYGAVLEAKLREKNA